MLSQITRGSTNEKIAFIFRLYDQNVDGYITKNEMLIITQAIYDMLGKSYNSRKEIFKLILKRHLNCR